MNEYKVHLITGQTVQFYGRYRRDLETTSWHYYERKDGTVIHFRKEHIVYVDGDTPESILQNRRWK